MTVASRVLSLGLTRGVIGGIVGAVLGMLLTMFLRVILLRPTAWEAVPVWAAASVFWVLGFLVGVGAFRDWFSWMGPKEAVDPPHHNPNEPQWPRYFNFDANHKVIGIQYIVTSVLLLCVAGLMALIIRTELAQPGMQVLQPDRYNHFIGTHGIVMIASILVGIGGLANYLLPLMLGAPDMAFPRLNALSYWFVPPGAVLVLASLFFGGFQTGWTGYPPLGAVGAMGAQFFYMGVFVIGLSSIFGSVNFLTTIFRMRPPGMSLFRMPIFVWGILATSLIQLIATQFIATSFLMVLFERLFGMGFFDPAKGGNVVLFQHFFWFYSHPAVYIFVLPGLAVISELLPVFARKPLFGYKWVALSSMFIAIVGHLVWVHHMFTVSFGILPNIAFMVTTMLVAVPTGVKFFSWLATMWGGKLSFETPMLFTLGAFVIFLVGGLTGPFLAIVPLNLYLHDTYWVVAHFHQVMFGGFVYPFMAAIYYWFPKMSGFTYNERLGKIHFWLQTIGFLVVTLGMYRVGLMGMRRRIADYDPALGVGDLNVMISIGGFAIAVGVLVFVINLIGSLRRKDVAAANPWRSRSPEWQIPSPAPEISFPQPVIVVGDPYEYGTPNTTYVRFGIAGASGSEDAKPAAG